MTAAGFRFARNLFEVRLAPKPARAASPAAPAPAAAVPPAIDSDPLSPRPGENVMFFRVKKILFCRDSFHLLLGRATGESRKDPAFADQDDIVVAGAFEPPPEEGLDYRIIGQWQTYQGRRNFRARVVEELMPRTAKGIASWLRRQEFEGLGPTRIARIAKAAASREDALSDVAFLEGFGLKTELAERIAASWAVSGAEAKVKASLYAFGVRGQTVLAIWREKGAAALDIMAKQPWLLCTEGFTSFEICDRMAISAGLPLDHPERSRAALLDVMRLAGLEGNTALPRERLLQRASRMTAKHPEELKVSLESLMAERKLLVPEDEPDLVQSAMRHAQEGALAMDLLSPERQPIFADAREAEDALRRAEERLGVTLDRSGGQFAAAIAALTSPLSVMTGGPGTGKTTTQRVIVEAIREAGGAPLLLSPTGRAAKRLSEATGAEAYTVAKIDHQFPHGTAEIRVPGEEDPREPDIAIVDEASMLCLDGATRMVRFLPPQCPIVFVGDIDQLPSVGAGALLRDVMDSELCAVRWLDRIHRQSGDSGIPEAARSILAREVPEGGHDVILHHCGDGNVVAMVQARVRSLIEEHGFQPDDIQVLAAMKKGSLGTYALNGVLRPLLNPEFVQHQATMRTIGGFQFCVNDRVMNTKNDYARGVMNGEIGVIKEFRQIEDDTRIVVEFEDAIVIYSSKDDADDEFPLMPCYATTVHKSQGCEFPAVVLAVPTEHRRMLSRNLVYTGLTRAKRHVEIIGDLDGLSYGIRSADVRPRITNLVRRLQEAARHHAEAQQEMDEDAHLEL